MKRLFLLLVMLGMLATACEERTIDHKNPIDNTIDVPENEIWYTSSDGNIVEPSEKDSFSANIVSNTYENGKGVIKFDGVVTTIGEKAFWSCDSLTSVTIPDSVTTIGEKHSGFAKASQV